MSTENKRVIYEEPLNHKIGRFLVSKGFILASSKGVRLDAPDISSQGILCKDTEAWSFWHLFRPKRRIFIGVIWFTEYSQAPYGASESNWIFEVFGRKYAEQAKQLAEEIASKFDVSIEVRLEEEYPKVEVFSGENAEFF